MRSNSGLSITFIILIGILTATSVYFFLKSQEKTPSQNTSNETATPTPTDTSGPTPSPTATPSPSSSLMIPAPSSNRPSNPAQTYKVKSGETLFMIGRRFDMTWTTIIAVNGISDENADKVKSGQTLIIPSYDTATKKFFVQYKTDPARAKTIQSDADSNPTQPYLDPIKVSKSDVKPIYSINASDDYILKSRNDYTGTAQIQVTHNELSYQIDLIQPIKKGKKGIWAIAKIQKNI